MMDASPETPEVPADVLSESELSEAGVWVQRTLDALGRVLFGQDELIERVLCACLARGHVLLEGLPGLGKTELAKGLSHVLGLDWRRLQFTPDLLPGDITGGAVLEQGADGSRALVFRPGPVFTQVLLADEINRASPKTQAALLEAMQERSVSTMGETRQLPDPFLVLATQNPIELEGTYPLPEAQLDRFLFKLDVRGVDRGTLERILVERRGRKAPELESVLDEGSLKRLFAAVDRVYLPRAVAGYIARLVDASHPTSDIAPDTVSSYVKHGGSPRAGIALAESARAKALIEGKPNVGFDDVRALLLPCLGHRLVLDYRARLDGIGASEVVDALLSGVSEVPGQMPSELRA